MTESQEKPAFGPVPDCDLSYTVFEAYFPLLSNEEVIPNL